MNEQAGNSTIIVCPYCGQPTEIVWAHGHGQCKICHTVIDECCRGEQAGDETNPEQDKNEKNKKSC